MILALAGGVGGARLANGLAAILAPNELTVAVNTGDDFEHIGLTVCPDIDTVTYTLAGRNDRTRGWGLTDETWSFMEELKSLGGPDWFALGDRDLAKHVWRTARLKAGESLSEITSDFARRQGIGSAIVPMSDQAVRTMIESDQGELSFQDYFVRLRCEPTFLDIRFAGADQAEIAPGLAATLSAPALQAIIICPSNPILSLGPMLAITAIRNALKARRVPCIAVSPFIGGEAIKGPAAKILRELGQEPGAQALLTPYAGIVDGILCDAADPAANRQIAGVKIVATDTLMADDAGQKRLAREALAFAASFHTDHGR